MRASALAWAVALLLASMAWGARIADDEAKRLGALIMKDNSCYKVHTHTLAAGFQRRDLAWWPAPRTGGPGPACSSRRAIGSTVSVTGNISIK